MELSPNGELLKWIKKLGSFDEECTVRGLEAAYFLDRTAIALDSGSQRACVVDLYGMRDRVRIEKKKFFSASSEVAPVFLCCPGYRSRSLARVVSKFQRLRCRVLTGSLSLMAALPAQAFYAAEMVMALEHMHTKNVIHR